MGTMTTAIREAGAATRRGRTEAALTLALTSHPYPMTADELAEATGITTSTVRTALGRIDGVLTRRSGRTTVYGLARRVVDELRPDEEGYVGPTTHGSLALVDAVEDAATHGTGPLDAHDIVVDLTMPAGAPAVEGLPGARLEARVSTLFEATAYKFGASSSTTPATSTSRALSSRGVQGERDRAGRG